MRRTLDDARIESPRGATITFINNQIGARVGAGEKIAVISDLTNYKVVAQTADAMAHYVKIGKRVVVKVGDDELKGVISNASPVSENGVIKFVHLFKNYYLGISFIGIIAFVIQEIPYIIMPLIKPTSNPIMNMQP